MQKSRKSSSFPSESAGVPRERGSSTRRRAVRSWAPLVAGTTPGLAEGGRRGRGPFSLADSLHLIEMVGGSGSAPEASGLRSVLRCRPVDALLTPVASAPWRARSDRQHDIWRLLGDARGNP